MKKQDVKYNGWKNYETWNVALWLQNDEPLYLAGQALKRPGHRLTGREAKAFVLDLLPDGTPDFGGQRGKYEKVHWKSIAECIQEF